jgi:hypothetical protein
MLLENRIFFAGNTRMPVTSYKRAVGLMEKRMFTAGGIDYIEYI